MNIVSKRICRLLASVGRGLGVGSRAGTKDREDGPTPITCLLTEDGSYSWNSNDEVMSRRICSGKSTAKCGPTV